MEFFTSAVITLQTLVIALGAGLAVWGIINLFEGYRLDNPGATGRAHKEATIEYRNQQDGHDNRRKMKAAIPVSYHGGFMLFRRVMLKIFTILINISTLQFA
jgi:hypothetical protein